MELVILVMVITAILALCLQGAGDSYQKGTSFKEGFDNNLNDMVGHKMSKVEANRILKGQMTEEDRKKFCKKGN